MINRWPPEEPRRGEPYRPFKGKLHGWGPLQWGLWARRHPPEGPGPWPFPTFRLGSWIRRIE